MKKDKEKQREKAANTEGKERPREGKTKTEGGEKGGW